MPIALEEKVTQKVPKCEAPEPYNRVKSVMTQVLAEERPHKGLLKAIISDLKILVERAERVRSLAPELAGVEVSPHIYKMLKMADRLQQQ